jgi:hypothetical protein
LRLRAGRGRSAAAMKPRSIASALRSASVKMPSWAGPCLRRRRARVRARSPVAAAVCPPEGRRQRQWLGRWARQFIRSAAHSLCSR